MADSTLTLPYFANFSVGDIVVSFDVNSSIVDREIIIIRINYEAPSNEPRHCASIGVKRDK